MSRFRSGKNRYPVKSLIKALRLLEALAESGGYGITELGGTVGMSNSTVHRLLATLKDRGYVLFDQTSMRYYLGGMVARLGDAMARQSPLLKFGATLIENLARQSNETVNLGILDGPDVVYVGRYESSHTLRAASVLGTRWPAYVAALGKACLSGHTDQEVLDLYENKKKLRKITPSTIGCLKDLLKQLTNVRREGIAYDNEENTPGVRCLAAPVRNSSGKVVAAISISGPKGRMTPDRYRTLREYLLRASAELSVKLGFGASRPAMSV